MALNKERCADAEVMASPQREASRDGGQDTEYSRLQQATDKSY